MNDSNATNTPLTVTINGETYEVELLLSVAMRDLGRLDKELESIKRQASLLTKSSVTALAVAIIGYLISKPSSVPPDVALIGLLIWGTATTFLLATVAMSFRIGKRLTNLAKDHAFLLEVTTTVYDYFKSVTGKEPIIV